MFQQTNIDAFLLVLGVSAHTRVYLFWRVVHARAGAGAVSGNESETVRKLRCLRIWGHCGAAACAKHDKEQERKVVKSNPGESCQLHCSLELLSSCGCTYNYMYQTLRGGKASPLILRSRDMQDSTRSLYISLHTICDLPSFSTFFLPLDSSC